MNPYDYYITPEEFEQAAKNGISNVTFYNRVRQLGWSKEKAMTTPPRKRSFHNNKWVQVAEKNGICISTYKYRINQLGWEPERAATQPLQDRKAHAEYLRQHNRKYPIELIQKAETNGVKYDTFRHRITKSKWSIEESANMPVMTFREIGLMTKEKRKRYHNRFFLKRRVK